MRLPFDADALIFDLDGTLLDTEPLYSEAAQRVLDPFGRIFTNEIKRRIMGGDSLTGARITMDALGMDMAPEEFLRQRESYLHELFPAAEEIPGSDQFLEAAHAAGYRIGLATSSHNHLAELKTGHREWIGLFNAIVCGDDPELQHGKPAPDIFLLCASRLSVDPARSIAFEDSRNGVLAAKAAGMKVIAVDSPYVGEGDLDDADLRISDYNELL